MNWREVPLATISKVVPDQSEVLAKFPQDWSAAEVSAFCWGRPDWILLLPIFGCVWGTLVRRWGEAVVSLAATQEFRDAVGAFRQKHGHSPHPGVVVEQLGRDPALWPKPPYAIYLPTTS